MKRCIYPQLNDKNAGLVIYLFLLIFLSHWVGAQSTQRSDSLQKVELKRQGYTLYNEISTIPLENIKSLAFYGDELKKVRKKLPAMPALKKLLIYNASGKKVKLNASQLPTLETVEINKHNSNIKKVNIRSKKLKNLQIYHSQLNDLPKLSQMKDLNRLQISNCNMNKASLNILKRQKGLNELSLMFDSLSYEAFRWTPLPKLQKLNLTGNRLDRLPPRLDEWDSLKDLNLAINAYTMVSEKHPMPLRLNSLSFYDNKLSTLPDDFYVPPGLEVLDLYYNHLTEIPKVVTGMYNLKMLYLSFNKINEIPEDLTRLKNLKALYLHHNKLTNLPEYLRRMSGLEILHVNSNYLLNCPDWMGDFKQMNDLDLSNNQLETLPLSLNELEMLEVINLRGNPFPENAWKAGPVYELMKVWKEQEVNVVR